MNGLFSLSTESIDYQRDDSFKIELVSLMEEIHKAILPYKSEPKEFDRLMIGEPFYKRLVKLLLKRFGLYFKIVTGTGHMAAVIPPMAVTNNVLSRYTFKDILRETDRDFRKMVLTLDKHLRKSSITVDLKKAKVSNYPKEAVITMFLDFDMLFLDFDLTAEEAAAVIMHEVGHAFTYLEYSDRMVRHNRVLVDSANSYLDDKDIKTFKYSLVDKIDDPKLKKKIKEVNTIENRVIWAVNLYGVMIDAFSYGSIKGSYGVTSGEQVADQFSTRLGFGSSLSSALVKLHDKYPNLDLMVVTSMLVVWVNYMLMAMSIAGVAAFNPAVMIVLMGIAVFFILNHIKHAANNHPYDDAKDRIKRIRDQAVTMLRDYGLSKKETAEVLKMIKDIDECQETVKDDVFIIRKIVDIMFYSRRVEKRTRQLEQQLETLAANDLYVQHAKLTLLG